MVWTLADTVVETVSENCLGKEKIWVRRQDFTGNIAKNAAQSPTTSSHSTTPTQREMAPISRRASGYSEGDEDDYSEAEYEDGVEQ